MLRRILQLLPCLALVACNTPRDDGSHTAAATLHEGMCDMVESESSSRCILWAPSLIELIAHPELYDGKRVRVIGFVNFEFEGNGLYVSREDWEQSIHRNGIWITPPAGYESDSAPASRRPNQQHVLVEGMFHAGRGGHFGMWSGSIDSVTRLRPWGRSAPTRGVLSRPLP